jgi:hypothetical protein
VSALPPSERVWRAAFERERQSLENGEQGQEVIGLALQRLAEMRRDR